jgi:hypothetical protein
MMLRAMNSEWRQLMHGLTALLFALLGILYLAMSWDGISTWWRFTSQPFEAVQDSPMRDIWTSGRVVPAMLFFFAAFLNGFLLFQDRNRKP